MALLIPVRCTDDLASQGKNVRGTIVVWPVTTEIISFPNARILEGIGLCIIALKKKGGNSCILIRVNCVPLQQEKDTCRWSKGLMRESLVAMSSDMRFSPF